VLWESNSIVRYLAAKHAAGTLYPSEPRARAEAERWMDWQLSTPNAGMVTIFWGLIRTKPEERNSAAIEAARQSMCEIWSRLDRYLADQPYVGGDRFTMGDIPIGALVYRWFNLAIERNDLPHLKAWYDRLTKRPGYQKHVMVVLS
jgi:glutathione S-transferase